MDCVVQFLLERKTYLPRLTELKAILPDAKLENPERFFRVNFDCLKCIFPDQIINNIILYLHKIYLNETIENKTHIKCILLEI